MKPGRGYSEQVPLPFRHDILLAIGVYFAYPSFACIRGSGEGGGLWVHGPRQDRSAALGRRALRRRDPLDRFAVAGVELARSKSVSSEVDGDVERARPRLRRPHGWRRPGRGTATRSIERRKC